MKKYKIVCLILFVILFGACNKDDNKDEISNVNWDQLKIGVINKDYYIVDNEISKLLVNLNSKPITDDYLGQKSNIDLLIEQINKSGKLTSELSCYACIKTNPPQSEIRITTDSIGKPVSRIIDILTSHDQILKFVNIHN